MSLVIGLIVLGSLGAAFLIIYHFFISYHISRKDTVDMLREHGIGDRPETIVKNYYKKQDQNLNEQQVRKKTKEFIVNNKEFFLTMWEQTKRKEKQ